MKIVHICNAPLPPDHPDYRRVSFHPGRWALNIARAQRDHCALDAELIVQVPGTARDHDAKVDTVPVHYMAAPDRLRSATLFQFDARRIARRVRSLNPDLVHAHGTEDAYALAAQASGYPNVITAQGLYFQINRKLKPGLISRAKAVELSEWLAFKRARHVITKSEYVARQLKSRFPHLILHPIPNTFDARLLDIREVKRPNSIVFVGTISPHKGVHTLQKALVEVQRQIPHVTLHIAGDSAKPVFRYEIEQKRLLRESLGDRVVFHGQLGVVELGRLVASSIALVAPSLEDMFGNQVVEAILLGTHGIVAEGTALAENIRRFGSGAVVPGEDPLALADAIVRQLTEPVSMANAQHSREAILAALAPAGVANLHLQLYTTILSERS